MASKLFLVFLFSLVGLTIISFLSLPTSNVPETRASSVWKRSFIDSGEPLYAVADLHGDYSKAIKALQIGNLVGSDGYWIGGKASLVQLGDLMDRGPYSLDCINLFERLKDEARQVGGNVQTLLGNHEMMNLDGQYRYVAKDELQRLTKDLDLQTQDAEQLTQEGLRLWQRLLQPSKELGKALRRMPTALLMGQGHCRSLFVHAGMLPGLLAQLELHIGKQAEPEDLLQNLNALAEGALQCAGGLCDSDMFIREVLHDQNGVLWYRGFATNREKSICSDVSAVLVRLNAMQMVVGHNVMPQGKPKILCGGTLYMMDVGMSVGYLDAAPKIWKCHRGHVTILQ